MKVFPVRSPAEESQRRPTSLAETVDTTRIADRYVLQEELVSTPRVRLMSAREARSDRVVLLRELVRAEEDPTFTDRLDDEITRLEALDHPAIPKLVETIQEGDRYYLVREHMGGVPLSAYRDQDPELVKARTETWINSLAEVLEDLHSANPPYVVGEFGPEDLLITAMGRLRFLPVRQETLQPPDLLEGDIGGTAQQTGTPAFFDVHALVRLAWWMLTGRVPVIGQAQPPLDPKDYPDLSESWLRGLSAAVDPSYPEPPQTITSLRMMLLGHAAVSQELPPKMEFEVAEVRYMEGPKGRMVQGTLHVWNTGGGELNGYCRTTQRWVRLIPNTFRGNDVEIEFWIDSSNMRAAEEHKAHVFIKSQNEEADIPVHVTTAPHWLSQLPTMAAAIMPFLPGMFLMLMITLVFWSAQVGAIATLEEIAGSTVTAQNLPDLLKETIPASATSPANARVSAAIALLAFAACPLFVFMIVRRFPKEQRQKLMWAQILGLLSPLLWLAILWRHPTYSHWVYAHPAFATLDVKGENLRLFVAANLIFALYFWSPVQARMDRAFRRNESARNLLTLALVLALLAMAAKLVFL